MALHSIFKNQKQIKILLFVITTFLLASFLNSCQDSLGYDPNVKIDPIINDTIILPPNDNNPVKYVIDSIKSSFLEVIMYKHQLIKFKWHGQNLRQEIKYDTSDNKQIIWVDWAMITTDKDNDYLPIKRFDRVVGFEMNFASVTNLRTFILNSKKDNRRWFLLKIKKIRTQKIYYFDGSRIENKVTFLVNDKERGMLTFMISSKLPFHYPFQTKEFTGLVKIFYSKK